MAVAIDNVSNSGITNSVSSKSWTHAVSGANRLLLVAVQWNQPSNSETVSSVTYNGTALTQVGSTIIAGGSGLDRCTALYKLVAPAAGSNTLVVTMSGSLAFYAGAVSFTGVNQSTPLGTPQTATTTTTATLSTTTASSVADMVFSAATVRTSSTLTTPTTQEWNAIIGTNNKYGGAVQAGASSVTSTYSWTGADNASMIAVDVLASSSLSITGRASISGTPMSTLTDDFSTDDGTKWTNTGTAGEITVSGGQLRISAAIDYPERDSIALLDLRNSFAFVQIAGRPTQTGDGANSTEMGFGVQLDANNYFVAIMNGTGNIVWRSKVGGVAGTTGFTTYNTTSMKWLRWRNSGTTVYLEAAANVSGPWTQLTSYPVSFSLAAVQAFMYAGHYGTVASPGTGIFDNFNVGFTKTQTGVARIAVRRSKTQTGVARISTSTSFALGGLGFPANPTKSITGTARIQLNNTASITGKASIVISPTAADPSVRPVVSEDAEDLYERLGFPYNSQDAQYGWALLRFCEAVCSNLQEVDDLVRDSDEGVGWSSALDIDRVSDEALPWLAQFVGVTTIAGLDPGVQRDRIRQTPGFQRGTVASLIGAARPYLTGSKTVVVDERTTSAYHLRVTTFLTETPDAALVESAVRVQKPAGLILDFVVSTGATYDELKATGLTYDQLGQTYSTYDVMKLTILA